MATCAYCKQRKGKRSCPALGGAICAQCCGTHRLREITCPPDCVYLGGLAAVRDHAASFTKQDYDALWKRMHAHADGARAFRDEALAACFDDSPDEWETGLATGYLHYGHRDRTGSRLVDRFAATKGRLLPLGEAAALGAIQRAWASLFEITSVQVGIGFEVRDLLTGERHEIREVSATGQLKRYDVLFAWLIAFPDHLELTGAACVVPRAHLDHVHAVLEAELARARTEFPELAKRDLPGSVAWAVLAALREAYRNFRAAKLATTDGEAVMFCKAHYTAADPATVRARFAERSELEPTDDGFIWLDRSRDPALTLGSIRFANGELLLETMSRERNARGRQLLETAAGELVVHRGDSVQDPDAAIREHRARPSTPARDEIPEDIQREVVGTYMRDYYMKWLDDSIPALGNKTPRKAVRTKKGRAQVEAMLKDLENMSAGMPGGDMIDLKAMRRELGLIGEDEDDDDDLDLATMYDAAAGPVAEAWLDLDESLRSAAVEAHHRTLANHPDMPNRRLHALIHVVVENQLAAGDPPATRTALERLLAAGVTRHGAIHAIGSVVAEALFEIQKHKQPFDSAAAARSLARLRPDDWRIDV